MDKAISKHEDIETIKKILNGNTGEFDGLVRKYKNMIFNLAYRMTGNLAEAEDVIQESFVRAYRSLKSFNPFYEFSNWLYTITINVCRSHNRRKRFRIFSLDAPVFNKEEQREWIPETGDSKGGDPESAVIREEEEKGMQRIIDSLPFKYRAIFVLRYIDNKSYQEIASCTELPLGTVKTYLFRGQKILCEKLKCRRGN